MSRICPFPIAKSHGAVAAAVKELLALNGAKADRHWHQLVKDKRLAMMAQGVSRAQADNELLAFGQAVFLALARRHSPEEGDAA
ncbi:MAG: hypothetical protein E5X72_00025 [Mesorhizobium sp.]|uniref:DUF6074 family protein n=1 Tax=Mesorhizobium sp. TaxID=1871066 RepID=UPI00121E7D1A|nr:DUF6074 family protein [Mesorhizobium sp.]TIP06637.1 MAG: hypothetical protein E5X72_00025 [Mesorhizobium sp.]